MKRNALRAAALALSLCMLSGCSSGEETTKKKKAKKTSEQEDTEIEDTSDEDPSSGKTSDQSETTAESSPAETAESTIETTVPPETTTPPETSASETSTSDPSAQGSDTESTSTAATDTSATDATSAAPSSEDTSANAEIKSGWLVDDSYFQASQTTDGKASFGGSSLCPGFVGIYQRFSTQEYQEKFEFVDTMTLDEYEESEMLIEEYAEGEVDGYISIFLEAKDPNSQIQTIGIMIFEEMAYDAPTQTYVIFELRDGVTEEDVFKREFQEMIYPYVETIYGKEVADIMVYSSEESLGYMRRIVEVDGYGRAPDYRVKRLVNHVYVEFNLMESTSKRMAYETGWDDYTPPT